MIQLIARFRSLLFKVVGCLKVLNFFRAGNIIWIWMFITLLSGESHPDKLGLSCFGKEENEVIKEAFTGIGVNERLEFFAEKLMVF
jgi:hypothetical protein